MARRWLPARPVCTRSRSRCRPPSAMAIGPSRLSLAEFCHRLGPSSQSTNSAVTEKLMKTVLRFIFFGLAALSVCYGQGVISTVAGNGTLGFSGDGGPATKAGIGIPPDVAIDGAGNLYIVDQGNNRIRKVDTSGTISTFAGNGTQD